MSKKATSPFDFEPSDNTSTESRRLDYTPALISLSNQRASELMTTVSKNPELHPLANKALDDGQPQDLIDLIKAVYDDEQLKTDAALLDGCDENQLSRLLESRRSDRSKSKKKGPRSNAVVCRTYISSMYAEMLIREYWNKPYTGQSNSVDYDLDALKDDPDALSRKIKSLQSSKSRISQLAEYDDDAKAKLGEIEAKIARLNSLRPTTRVQNRTIVKDIGVDKIRDMLSTIDPATLPEGEQAKLLELMKKLG